MCSTHCVLRLGWLCAEWDVLCASLQQLPSLSSFIHSRVELICMWIKNNVKCCSIRCAHKHSIFKVITKLSNVQSNAYSEWKMSANNFHFYSEIVSDFWLNWNAFKLLISRMLLMLVMPMLVQLLTTSFSPRKCFYNVNKHK